MKKIEVSSVTLTEASPLHLVAETLDTMDKNNIGIAPWKPYEYKPIVDFSIGHNNKALFIKFNVEESAIQAKYRNINDPVYRDSCVELFLAVGNDACYYNFEFNLMGTCRAGYGAGRYNRELLPHDIINQIGRYSVVRPFTDKERNIKWSLTLVIPIKVFHKHEITQLKGLQGKANFFKCGDDLPQVHFLSWTNIESETPNFHLPKYFGSIHFI